MSESEIMRFGPHTPKVHELLRWIDQGELLRFGMMPPSDSFITISDFNEAQSIAQGGRSDIIDWTSVRDNADASLYEVGLLDTELWLPYKKGIKGLPSLIADKVCKMLPKGYFNILDDVIADLDTCALCVAIHGHLNSFHAKLWKAYTFGGWPCGCTGGEFETPEDYEQNVDNRLFYIFWKSSI